MLELNFKNAPSDAININMVFMLLNHTEIDTFSKCFLNSLALGTSNTFEMYMRLSKFVKRWVSFESVLKNDGLDLLPVLIVAMLSKEITALKLYTMRFTRIATADCSACFVTKPMTPN